MLKQANSVSESSSMFAQKRFSSEFKHYCTSDEISNTIQIRSKMQLGKKCMTTVPGKLSIQAIT